MILGILTTVIGVLIYTYVFPPIGGAISVIGFLWFIAEVFIFVSNSASRAKKIDFEKANNDLYQEYKKKRLIFPTSDETIELSQKLFVDHDRWLQNCVDEIEVASKRNWDDRKYFISQDKGIVYTSSKVEDLDKLFNYTRHYRLVCEHLNRQPIKELEDEIENALIHIQKRQEIYDSMSNVE